MSQSHPFLCTSLHGGELPPWRGCLAKPASAPNCELSFYPGAIIAGGKISRNVTWVCTHQSSKWLIYSLSFNVFIKISQKLLSPRPSSYKSLFNTLILSFSEITSSSGPVILCMLWQKLSLMVLELELWCYYNSFLSIAAGYRDASPGYCLFSMWENTVAFHKTDWARRRSDGLLAKLCSAAAAQAGASLARAHNTSLSSLTSSETQAAKRKGF